MVTRYRKFALVAAFGLALAFIFSCSGDDGDNDDPYAGIPGYERWRESLKYYDPDDAEERCQNGAVEKRCEVDGKGVWYSPLTHFCEAPKCQGDDCGTPHYELLGTIKRCGNKLYCPIDDAVRFQGKIIEVQRCQNGVLERMCGGSGPLDVWYNKDTQYCEGNGVVIAKKRCGSGYYRPSESTRCRDGVVEEKCGGWNSSEEGIWYNTDTHYCSQGYDNVNHTHTNTVKPRIRCGNEYLDGDYHRCNNGVVEEICGDPYHNENPNWYNEITQSCNYGDDTVKDKVRCGG